VEGYSVEVSSFITKVMQFFPEFCDGLGFMIYMKVWENSLSW